MLGIKHPKAQILKVFSSLSKGLHWLYLPQVPDSRLPLGAALSRRVSPAAFLTCVLVEAGRPTVPADAVADVVRHHSVSVERRASYIAACTIALTAQVGSSRHLACRCATTSIQWWPRGARQISDCSTQPSVQSSACPQVAVVPVQIPTRCMLHHLSGPGLTLERAERSLQIHACDHHSHVDTALSRREGPGQQLPPCCSKCRPMRLLGSSRQRHTTCTPWR